MWIVAFAFNATFKKLIESKKLYRPILNRKIFVPFIINDDHLLTLIRFHCNSMDFDHFVFFILLWNQTKIFFSKFNSWGCVAQAHLCSARCGSGPSGLRQQSKSWWAAPVIVVLDVSVCRSYVSNNGQSNVVCNTKRCLFESFCLNTLEITFISFVIGGEGHNRLSEWQS